VGGAGAAHRRLARAARIEVAADAAAA
jgi:hypothetical protein